MALESVRNFLSTFIKGSKILLLKLTAKEMSDCTLLSAFLLFLGDANFTEVSDISVLLKVKPSDI